MVTVKKVVECYSNCDGWKIFCEAIDRFSFHPEKCGFINLKDSVDDLYIDEVRTSGNKIKLIVNVWYKNDMDIIDLEFTERELNTKIGMREWIRVQNLKTQKVRKKEELVILKKLLRRYKDDWQVREMMRNILTLNK